MLFQYWYYALLVMQKYLQPDWSRRVQYLPYCTLGFNIVLFDKKQQQQHSNAVTGKIRNLFVQNKLMIDYYSTITLMQMINYLLVID